MNVLVQRFFVVSFKDLDKWQIPRVGLVPDSLPQGWRVVRIGDFAHQITNRVRVESGRQYKLLGVKWYAKGVFLRENVDGDTMSAAWVTPAKPGAFIYNRLFAWKESFAVVPPDFANCFVSSEFPQFILDATQISADYLFLLFRLKSVIGAVNAASAGSAAVSRNRFKEEEFLRMELAIPPIETQQAILSRWKRAQSAIAQAENMATKLRGEIDEVLLHELAVDVGSVPPTRKAFTVWWKEMSRWDVIFAKNMRRRIESARYPILTLQQVILPLRETTGRLTPAEKPAEIFNYIGMENVESISGRLIDFAPISGSKIKSSCVVFDADHILYGKLRPYLRKVIAPQEEGLDRGVASSEFLTIKPNEKVLKEYLLEYLRSSLVAEQASQAIGARMPRVALETFLSFSIPVPDLAKQKAIVDQLKSLRDGITRERETARIIAREIEVDTEAYLLGTKKVRTP
jgi:type I restriction enzyme S subunit